MKHYYVNDRAQDNGDHEVHDEDCTYCPDRENRTYLGYFSSCRPAVKEAKEYYTQVNGCYYCASACHTT